MFERNYSTLFGISARRPVHNHALVNTADLPGSTWFETGRCYAGTLPPLGSGLSISLWLTKTQAGFCLFLSAQYRVISILNTINSMQTSFFFVLLYLNSKTSITGGCGSDFLSSQISGSFEQISSFSSFLLECAFLVLVTHIILFVVSLGLLYYNLN